jgi:Holliday junction resolvasome RuvABC endonuclease subunit
MIPVLGLDLSYTATGVCFYNGETFIPSTLGKSKSTGPGRLHDMLGEIAEINLLRKPRLVAIEGYAFAANSQAHKIGELGGIIKHYFWTQGIPTLIVSPTVLKKWITGKGVGSKGAVMVAVYKALGVECKDDNAADATVLAHMAYQAMNGTRTKAQAEALTKCETIPGRTIPVLRKRPALLSNERL